MLNHDLYQAHTCVCTHIHYIHRKTEKQLTLRVVLIFAVPIVLHVEENLMRKKKNQKRKTKKTNNNNKKTPETKHTDQTSHSDNRIHYLGHSYYFYFYCLNLETHKTFYQNSKTGENQFPTHVNLAKSDTFNSDVIPFFADIS